MRKTAAEPKPANAIASCVCGTVRIEIEVPAFWAWHDHSQASRRAQGCAYATYIGTWKSRMRVVKGARHIARFEDQAARTVRSFCAKCGTPLAYERAHSPKMINIPRAIFAGRTGREPRYHLHFDEMPEWAYRCEPLVPLKGYPGVVWERPGRKKKISVPDPFA